MPSEINDTSNIQASQDRHKPLLPEAERIQLVVFSLEDESFGTDIKHVREIVRVGPVTPIPDSPNFIKGVTNIRGEIVIVIDLKERFFLPVKKPVESKHIVITGQEGNLYGVLVDEVTEVLRIPRAEIKTTPHLITKIDRAYISGVITLEKENRLIMLLDLKKVLLEEELDKLARMTLHQKTIWPEKSVLEEVSYEQDPQKSVSIGRPEAAKAPKKQSGSEGRGSASVAPSPKRAIRSRSGQIKVKERERRA